MTCVSTGHVGLDIGCTIGEALTMAVGISWLVPIVVLGIFAFLIYRANLDSAGSLFLGTLVLLGFGSLMLPLADNMMWLLGLGIFIIIIIAALAFTRFLEGR